MPSEFINWLVSVFVSSGAIGIVLYTFRDAIGAFLTKSVEHRFERKLEVFRSEIREGEAELDQIRTYLTSAQRDREASFQQKKLEAAENLLRARFVLSQMGMLVEFMKSFKEENVLKSDDPNVAQAVQELIKPFEIDEKLKSYGLIDKTLPKLYLGQKSLDAFNVYEAIVMQAIMMMKLFSIELRDKLDLIKRGDLGKKVQELVPTSSEGFEKFGDRYAYYWADYFHDEILKALRHEVSGLDEVERDTKSVERLAIDSRRAQMRARITIKEAGLSDQLINTVEQVDNPTLD
jgi:hypothetical protein